MPLEPRKRTPQVFEQQVAQVAAHSMAHQDPLDYEILPVRRHRIRWHLPSARAEPIGKIVKRKAIIGPFPESPADRRQSAIAIVNYAERPHLSNFSRQVLRGLITGVLDFPIAFKTQSQKIVVLANDLTSRPRKVQRE